MFKKISIVLVVIVAMFFIVANAQKKPITLKDKIANLVKQHHGISKPDVIQFFICKGYDVDDIRKELDQLKINWNYQALMAGWKFYQFDLNKKEIAKCLKFQKFTDDEINYAINQIFKK